MAKPAWSDSSKVWQLPYKIKRQVFGEENLPLPGGPCPVSHDQENPPRQSEMVPVFFHECPDVVAAEIAHLSQATAILDLTPGSGHFASFAVRHRIPYTGVVFNKTHRDFLGKRLVSKVLAGMADSNDNKLFDPSFAEAVKALGGKDGDGKDDKTMTPKRRSKRKIDQAQSKVGEDTPKQETKNDKKPKTPKKTKRNEDDGARQELLNKIKAAASAADE